MDYRPVDAGDLPQCGTVLSAHQLPWFEAHIGCQPADVVGGTAEILRELFFAVGIVLGEEGIQMGIAEHVRVHPVRYVEFGRTAFGIVCVQLPQDGCLDRDVLPRYDVPDDGRQSFEREYVDDHIVCAHEQCEPALVFAEDNPHHLVRPYVERGYEIVGDEIRIASEHRYLRSASQF